MGKQIGALIAKSKKFYYSLGSIYSQKLNQTIVFNRYGWKHLLYDSSDRRRNNTDIELRLFLLREAKTLITNSKYPVIASVKDTPPKNPTIQYFEFYGKSLKMNRYIKVIVRKIGEGNYHFFSIRRSKRNKKPAT